VLLSVPHTVWPQFAVTAPSRPVPEQLQPEPQPVAAKDQPLALQVYVLLSVPQVDAPQLTVTGPLAPVPEHVQAAPLSVTPQPAAENVQLLPPGELHMYVLPSVPHVV